MKKPLRNPALIHADLLGIPLDDPSVQRAAAFCAEPATKAELRKAGLFSKTARPAKARK